MPCTWVNLPGGGQAIVCGSRPRLKPCTCGSGRKATLLCDWKVEGGTCDKPICASCTTIPALDKDLCPEHTKAWMDWKARR